MDRDRLRTTYEPLTAAGAERAAPKQARPKPSPCRSPPSSRPRPLPRGAHFISSYVYLTKLSCRQNRASSLAVEPRAQVVAGGLVHQPLCFLGAVGDPTGHGERHEAVERAPRERHLFPDVLRLLPILYEYLLQHPRHRVAYLLPLLPQLRHGERYSPEAVHDLVEVGGLEREAA